MTVTWTAEDHYAAAQQHLADALASKSAAPVANHLAVAQVHATLALYRAWTDQPSPAAPEATAHDPWAAADAALDAALAESEATA